MNIYFKQCVFFLNAYFNEKILITLLIKEFINYK